MAKLILREACFVGIDNAVVREIQKTPEHKSFKYGKGSRSDLLWD